MVEPLENELQLIIAVQKGETEVFGALYDHYIEPIYRFVYFKTHHVPTAEDLTSDIFIKAIANIQSYRREKGSFISWLYQIARNTIIDHYRRGSWTRPIDDVWDLKSHDDPARDTDERLLFEELYHCLHHLSPEERDTVVLRVWQGLSHKEIAVIVGKTEMACKKIYSRAISKMRADDDIRNWESKKN